jgi:uracil-DNA glycosylase family 4
MMPPRGPRDWTLEIFDVGCTLCPRLAAHLRAMRSAHPDYHNAPVPPFGDPHARLLIVGLAPGAHGANATGRPFTGDHAGILLYRTLHAAGLATQPQSTAGDALELANCRITNAVKCLPPENKPTNAEVDTCNRYLRAELARLGDWSAVLALGTIAHRAVLRALRLKVGIYPFAHGRVHDLPDGRALVDSYHCSRYNTQTRRLTEEMFTAVVARANELATERARPKT